VAVAAYLAGKNNIFSVFQGSFLALLIELIFLLNFAGGKEKSNYITSSIIASAIMTR
jgi:hypothetical protein